MEPFWLKNKWLLVGGGAGAVGLLIWAKAHIGSVWHAFGSPTFLPNVKRLLVENRLTVLCPTIPV